MTLREINAKLAAIVDLDGDRYADTETGEVFSAADIDALELEWAEKIEACIIVYKEMMKDYKGLDAEEKEIAKRKRYLGNNMNRLKECIAFYLNGQPFASAKAKADWRSSPPSVTIADGAIIPAEYIRTTTAPDKEAIKNALKQGIQIDGCSLVQSQYVILK